MLRKLIFLLLIGLLFVNNGSVSLWDQDESAYAAFAYKMNESGNYLIPEFWWSDMHRKPPLHFWDIAGSYKLFGVNEFAVRFPSALAIALLYIVVFLFCRRISGQAFRPLLVLGTGLLIPFLAKVSLTDATLLLFTTICAVSLWQLLQRRSLPWLLSFWGAFALALLTKGPPVIIFCGGLVLLLAIFHPQRKALLRLHPWFFLPLAAAPLLYWAYRCDRLDGGVFTRWMLDWYVLRRIGGSVLGQSGPPGTHLLFMIAAFLPWLMFLPRAMWDAFRGLRGDALSVFLGAWFIAGWLPWEFTPSKLPAYAVAAHVPLAILIARRLPAADSDPRRGFMYWLQFALMGLVFLAMCIAPFLVPLPQPLGTCATIAGGLLFLLLLYVFLPRQGFLSGRLSSKLFLLALVFQCLLWGLLLRPADALKNTQKQIGEYVQRQATPGSKVVIGNHLAYPPSLPFYLYLNFKDIHLEQDKDQVGWLFEIHKERTVFILNAEQRDHLLKAYPDLQYATFHTNFTDRRESSAYYVVVRK